jgi:sec-independent protein translocase protein TatC
VTDPEPPAEPRPFVRPRPEPAPDPLGDDGLEVPPPLPGHDDGDGEKVMTLVEHLSELRFRILASLGSVLVCACFTLYHSATLTEVILATAPKIQFIALTPMEVFFTQLKIGLLTALIAAVPMITWQIWAFVRPGLRDDEARAVGWFGPVTSVLFLVGGAFAFRVVIPVGVRFLSSFELPGVVSQYSLEAYTSFVLFMVLAMGLIFEAPVVILILARLGLVTSESLAARRRIVILGCFIAAALITPTPDMVTQSLVAIPLWLLFEGTLVALKILGW